jgi:hypothetical protein
LLLDAGGRHFRLFDAPPLYRAMLIVLGVSLPLIALAWLDLFFMQRFSLTFCVLRAPAGLLAGQMVIAQTAENFGRRREYRILNISLYLWPKFLSAMASGGGVEVDPPSDGKGVVKHWLEHFLRILLLSSLFGSLGVSRRDRSSECHVWQSQVKAEESFDPNLSSFQPNAG